MRLRLLERLEADDIFVSYSRLDGAAYVKGLIAALAARGFSCYSDQRGTDAGEALPESLLARVRRCKTLVLLETPGARSRPHNMGKEVSEFASANGTARIVTVTFPLPVDSPTAQSPDLPWRDATLGKVREQEELPALKTGEPAAAVVDAIAGASDYMKSKDRLVRYRNRALMTLGALIVLNGAAVVTAQFARSRAADEGAIAEARSLANISMGILQQPEGSVQEAIGRAISAVATASARGRRTPEGDAALRTSMEFLMRYTGGHAVRLSGGVTALTSDGRHVAFLTREGELRILRVGDAKLIKAQHLGSGVAIAVDSALQLIAVAEDSAVRVVNLRSGHTRTIVLRTDDPADDLVHAKIEQVALSPNGQLLAMISTVEDQSTQGGMSDIENGINALSLWNVASGRKVADLSAGDRNHMIAFSPTGELAVAAGLRLRGEYSGFTGLVAIWRPTKASGAGRLSFSPDDLRNPERYTFDSEVTAIALAGSAEAFATERGLWRRNALGGLVELARFPADTAQSTFVSALAFNSVGDALSVVRQVPGKGRQRTAADSLDVGLENWDATNHPDLTHLFVRAPVAAATTLSSDGAFSIFAAYADGAPGPRRFELKTGRALVTAPSGADTATTRAITGVGGGGRFAAWIEKDTVIISDAARAKVVPVSVSKYLAEEHGYAVAIGPDGRLLAVAGADSSGDTAVVAIFERHNDVYTFTRQFRLGTLHPSEVGASVGRASDRLLVSGDGLNLVLLARDESVHLWRLADGKEVTPQVLQALAQGSPSKYVTRMRLSARGRYLAVGYRDGCPKDESGSEDCDPEDDFAGPTELNAKYHPEVVVLSIPDGAVVAKVPHAGGATAFEFSASERYLLSGADDFSTYVTDLVAKRSTVLHLGTTMLTAAAFSSNEAFFAVGSGDRVRVFMRNDLTTAVASLPETGAVTALAASPDGQYLVSASQREGTVYEKREENYVVRVWIVDSERLIDAAREAYLGIPQYLRDKTLATRVRELGGRH